MPKKHYAGEVQQAIAAEIAQLRAQQSVAPARAKQIAPQPDQDEEIAVYGRTGDIAMPGSPASEPVPAPARQGSAAPPAPPAGAASVAPPAAAPRPVPPPARVFVPPASPVPLPTTDLILTSLDQRINRLEQVRQWIGEDGEMARFLDTVIGQQVQSSERRQARFAIVLNIIFLIAGWALAYFLTVDNISKLLSHL